MKTTMKVTTVIEITGVKVSWEILEVLKKSFKKSFDKVCYTEDTEGFSFRSNGNLSIDLKSLEEKVNKICERVHAKEHAAEIKQEAKSKKKMEGFTGFVLTPVRNKHARRIDDIIIDATYRIKDYMAENEFYNAECTFDDAEDMIQLRKLLEAKDADTYKFIRSLDTSVRETIPEEVYEYIDDLATGG